MAEYTTIALHHDDKNRLDDYIRTQFGTDPADTPYRLAIDRLLCEANEDG